jgi:hypothetical protein
MDIAERVSCEVLASVSCRYRSTIAAADVECRPEVWWSSFSWCMMRHSKFGMFAPLSIYTERASMTSNSNVHLSLSL